MGAVGHFTLGNSRVQHQRSRLCGKYFALRRPLSALLMVLCLAIVAKFNSVCRAVPVRDASRIELNVFDLNAGAVDSERGAVLIDGSSFTDGDSAAAAESAGPLEIVTVAEKVSETLSSPPRLHEQAHAQHGHPENTPDDRLLTEQVDKTGSSQQLPENGPKVASGAQVTQDSGRGAAPHVAAEGSTPGNLQRNLAASAHIQQAQVQFDDSAGRPWHRSCLGRRGAHGRGAYSDLRCVIQNILCMELPMYVTHLLLESKV